MIFIAKRAMDIDLNYRKFWIAENKNWTWIKLQKKMKKKTGKFDITKLTVDIDLNYRGRLNKKIKK